LNKQYLRNDLALLINRWNSQPNCLI